MNNDNTRKILNAVERAKREISSAESHFRSAKRSVESKANYTTINIYNMSAAVEIVAEAKRATDELYASYESIIRILDAECRPLLNESVSASAIKQVADLTRKINRESSSIKNNTTGSLNSYSLGDLRTEYYITSVEARTIEKFWASKVSPTYGGISSSTSYRERTFSDRVNRRELLAEREEERKREAEKKQLQEKLKAEEEKRISEANEVAKKHMEKCTNECHEKLYEYEKRLKETVEKQRRYYQKEIDEKLAELNQAKEEKERKLLSLSVLKISEKKLIKQEIEKIEKRILKYKDPSVITSEIESMEMIAKNSVSEYKKEIQSYLSKRFKNYGSNVKCNSKTELLYTENEEMAQMPYPTPPDIETVF